MKIKLQFSFILTLLFFNYFILQGKSSDYYLKGFSLYPYFNEQVKIFSYYPEVRVFINAPSPQTFDPTKKVGLAIFALPNGNTIEHTIGKVLQSGDDWHYDIQHIGAQTRFLRSKNPEYNLVTVYLETTQLSWPSWRSKYTNNATIINSIVDSLRGMFSQFNPFVILTGHSGGGSFTFGYMNAVSAIPNFIERITFLDSDYNYDNTTYGQKILNWLNASTSHTLCVIAYNDSIALYNGQPVVSPTGGTWYRSRMMATYLANYFPFTTEIDSNFVKYTALNGRVKFILKQNPTRAILHTVQVELNGFIHGLLTGTALEGSGYTYYGSRAYTPLIQSSVVFPTPMNIPVRNPLAKTGSQFMTYVSNMTFDQRETEIYKEISTGNIPDFLRNLRRITTILKDINNVSHTISFDVMPDYLAIGSDNDFCRIPMGPKTAQKIADLFGACMPTPKLVDTIYSNCQIKLAPVTYTPVGNQNELVPKFVLHNIAIDSQRNVTGGQLGQLTGGTKKDVVLSNKIIDPARPNHVCIYGWHQLNGLPIQPLTNVHIDSYVDYSHGIRLVNKEVLIDGQVKSIPTILKDPVLYATLSNESGVMNQPSYFADNSLPVQPKSFVLKSENSSSLRLIIKNDTLVSSYIALISRDGKSFKDSVALTKSNLVISGLMQDSIYFIKIKGVNSIGSSIASEVLSSIPTNTNANILIVHGFDRNSTGNIKDFIRQHAIAVNKTGRPFTSSTNDAVIDGLISLTNYKTVDYILGDESTVDETFSTSEQSIVKNFLMNGGNLFVSGSEIAWDLDTKGATSDKDFIWNYLKVKYINDAPNGAANTTYQAEVFDSNFFNGVQVVNFDNGTHGTINVGYPDVVRSTNGGKEFVKYSTLDTLNGYAGCYFSGKFPGGTKQGKVVFLGFPFESVYIDGVRNLLMQRILEYFDIPSDVESQGSSQPLKFNLEQNYPNPFNPSTNISYQIAGKGEIFTTLTIFDLLGGKIESLIEQNQKPGNYNIQWNGTKYPSGTYFYKLSAGDNVSVKKMLLLK